MGRLRSIYSLLHRLRLHVNTPLMHLKILLAFCLLHPTLTFATPEDSVKRKVHHLFITTRFNTLNMAPVSGNIVNRNVNADMTIAYAVGKFTLTLQNGVDLEDRRSEMNYLLINARYKLNLTRTLSVSPFLAFYSEHTNRFIDKGADANGGMFFTFQNRSFTVEAFALIVRLTHESHLKEAINRVEIKWKSPSITLSAFVYHNARYFDEDERISIGFRAALPEFKIFDTVSARTDLTGSFKVYDYPESKSLNGVFLSLVFPVKI
jgi:hypothetical protein